MTVQNKKAKIKSKTKNNNTTRVKNTKKKKKDKIVEEGKKINLRQLLIGIFFTGILLLVSSYAWFYATVDVRIKFLDLVISNDSALFISLDGVNFSDSVQISVNSVISDLKSTYPNHTNQWDSGGLWPVSSNGIRNSNSDKFDVFVGEVSRYKVKNNRRYLNTTLIKEEKPNASNLYIAFDIFLKNVSGAPNSDNLYLGEDTFIDYENDTPDDIKTAMSGIMNSMRIGFVKIGSVPSNADVSTIQNIKCDDKCEVVIYEPNSTSHSERSIDAAKEYGITLVEGVYCPSYAVTKEGVYLDHTTGQVGSGIPLDTKHFTLQKTITDFDKPIFQLPNGITKFRAYVWIEGQDIDSLETYSRGADIFVSIEFIKDLAGFE